MDYRPPVVGSPRPHKTSAADFLDELLWLGAYVGDAPVHTVWIGASVAGLPEDLAARHVQTICTGLAPLLAGSEDQT